MNYPFKCVQKSILSVKLHEVSKDKHILYVQVLYFTNEMQDCHFWSKGGKKRQNWC